MSTAERLGIHLINETAGTVRAKLMLRCFKDGETVVMRRERDVELQPRSSQTISFAELIGSFFDITYAYHSGPPSLDATLVTLGDLARAIHFPLGRAVPKNDPALIAETMRDETGWLLKLRATRLAPAEERIVASSRLAARPRRRRLGCRAPTSNSNQVDCRQA
jgi:beta-mannosidase